MSGIVVLWVGRRAAAPWEELARTYARRIARHLDLADVRVRPAAGRRSDPARARAVEASELHSHLASGDHIVALDERGREHSSEELADWLAQRRRLARRLVFVIGSDLGLDATVTSRAAERLALSRLTLPHELVRVLLLEQLYRAIDLSKAGCYHRGGS
jgi:23S rRNA (pseudouridine1915-N3)-methyltransferase